MKKSIRLCENKTFTWNECRKLSNTLFSVFNIEITRISYTYVDTDAGYGIHTEAKLNKQKKIDIEIFMYGFVTGLNYQN